jgi:multimeric flavodoxin WrbA
VIPVKAILLDGAQANDDTSERVHGMLEEEFRAQGWDVEHVVLREKRIADCAGDYFCWVRTPGVCHVDDDNRAIAAAVIASDLLVYLTPVTFGGYSSALKRMVDHQIQNIAPFFATVEGETHHQKRYAKHPDLLVVGWADAPDAPAQAVFRHLAQRNALNYYAERSATGVIVAGQSDEEIRAQVQGWLLDLRDGRTRETVQLPVGDGPLNALKAGGHEIRRALLLVGSPRRRTSTSRALGEYLFEQLRPRSIETETIYLHTVLRSPEKTQTLLSAVNEADLVALAFPLYVDSLPAPVIDALERISAHRKDHEPGRRQLFVAIANCGFPEVQHTATALAITETFARQAGFVWAGSLALGGGEGIGESGTPLSEMGGRVAPLKKPLILAAEALAQGQAIPRTAQDLLAKPVIPHWLYRLAGGHRWRRGAKKYGVKKSLRRRPYSS